MLAFLILQVAINPPETFTFSQYDPIELRADIALDEGYKIVSRTWDVDKPAKGRVYDNGSVFTMWAPPGEYIVEMNCLLINWEVKDFKQIQRIFTVHVQGAQPPPPNPTPGPVVGQLSYIVILQDDQTTIKQAQQLLLLREKMPEKYNLTLAHIEDLDSEDNPTKTVVSYKPLVKEYPAVFFVAEKGGVLKQFKFDTFQGVLDEISRTNN